MTDRQTDRQTDGQTHGKKTTCLPTLSGGDINIMVFNPSAGADEALGPFSFFRIINILSICQFPADFPLQITF